MALDYTKVKVDKTCYHCGADCTSDPVVDDEHTFCCDGCRLVYDLLKENNLCTYYTLDKAPGRPAVDQNKNSYSVLDRPDIRSQMLRFDDGERARIIFRVDGMHCSSCIWLLEHLPRFNAGIISAEVNFPMREVTIDFRSAKTTPGEIATLLSSVGYAPSINLSDLAPKQKKKIDNRIIKIGVAGFCFANIMMLSFPEYLAGGDLAGQERLMRFFSWLSLGLSLPVLLYSGSGFFISAWKAIRYRALNIDAPIALAITVTFLRSVYAIGFAGEAGFLDSMSGIIFFMLIGRYFQDRTYERMNFERDYKSYFPIAVTVKKAGVEESVPVTEVVAGDRIYIRANELVPADSIVLSDRTYIDYSFVTGESEPVVKMKGDKVFAGARQTGGAADFEVVSAVSSGYLTQLWNNDAVSKRKKEVSKTYIDNINKWFSAGVLLTAFGGAIGWLFVDPSVSLNAMTSVLIVACPCTLLLAATFTNGSVLRWLARSKFYLKNADAIERLSTADTIVFDKTGTITGAANSQVIYEGKKLSERDLNSFILLAKQSGHPLSRALVAAHPGKGIQGSLTQVTESTGGGMIGVEGGRTYLLGSAKLAGANDSEVASGSCVWLAVDGNVLGKFIIRNRYRTGLESLIARLKRTFSIELLSGDNELELEKLLPVFGEKMFFRKTPAEKLEHIIALKAQGKKVIMVGDGLNDAGALLAADGGIAISDNTNNYFPACDAILDGSNFDRLDQLLAFTRVAGRVVKFAFVISVMYNFVGAWFSLSGQMSPLIAAILMPTSSITVVLLTTLSVRIGALRYLRATK